MIKIKFNTNLINRLTNKLIEQKLNNYINKIGHLIKIMTCSVKSINLLMKNLSHNHFMLVPGSIKRRIILTGKSTLVTITIGLVFFYPTC